MLAAIGHMSLLWVVIISLDTFWLRGYLSVRPRPDCAEKLEKRSLFPFWGGRKTF